MSIFDVITVKCANNCPNVATVMSYVIDENADKCSVSGYCPCCCTNVPLCEDCYNKLPNRLEYRNRRGFVRNEQTSDYITLEQFEEELFFDAELKAAAHERNIDDFYHKRGIYDIEGTYGLNDDYTWYDLESPLTMRDMR